MKKIDYTLKSTPKSTKVFLLTIIVAITLLIVLPKDDCGNICGAKSPISFIIFLLMALLPFALVIIERKRKKISNPIFIGILLFLIIFSLFLAMTLLGKAYCRSSWARTLSNISQLRSSQEMFYSEKKRYADTQEELIEGGIIDTKFKDWVTDKELTDRDGMGIEGGDNDPETWSVTAFIPHKEIDRWCRVISKGYWYTCNQDTCYHEK